MDSSSLGCVTIPFAFQLFENGPECIGLKTGLKSSTAFFTLEDMQMLGQAEVYLNRSEGPQAMQGNMAVVWLDIRHASLSLFSSAEHSRQKVRKIS